MSNGRTIAQDKQGRTRSPKHLSVFILVFTALIATFIIPLATVPSQAAEPITHTLYIAYATRATIPTTPEGKAAFKDSFLSKTDLDALIAQTSEYWKRETKGAIAEIKYDWDEVQSFQIPASYPIWDRFSASASTYGGLSTEQFPNVDVRSSSATHIVTFVKSAEVRREVSSIDMAGQGDMGAPSLTASGNIRILLSDTPLNQRATDSRSLAHEFGHNLGLDHAGVGTCPNSTYDGSFTSGQCQISTYGDGLDLMGTGDINSTLSAYRKSQLGLLDNGGRIDISDSYSGSTTLSAVENLDFSRVNEIRITDPWDPSAVYSIEYRKNAGVRVLRVFSPSIHTAGNTASTAVLSPTLTDGAKGTLMKAQDSFTSISGQVSFSVVSMGADQAIIQIKVNPVTLSAPTLDVTPQFSLLPEEGGTVQISVESNTSWVVSVAPGTGTKASPTFGIGNGSFEVTLEPNSLNSGMSRIVTVRTDSGTPMQTRPITVRILGHNVPVSVYAYLVDTYSTSWIAPPEGGEKEISVISNTMWSVSDLPDWIISTPSSGFMNESMVLRAQPNTTGVPRSGTVTVKTTVGSPEASSAIKVTQDASDCGASTNEYCSWLNLSTPVNGTIETSGDKDWFQFVAPSSGLWTFTSSMPASNPLVDSYGTLYSSDGAGLTSDDDSAGNGQFKVSTLLTSGQTYYLEVRAAGSGTGNYTVTAARETPTLTVSPDSWSVPVDGGTQVLTVTSNTSWSMNVPSWLTASSSSGVGNGSVTLTAPPYTPSSSLLNFIIVGTTSGDSDALSLVVVARQLPLRPTLTVSPESWSVVAGGGTQAVTVTSNTTWSVSKDATWITLTSASGSGNAPVLVQAAANTTTSSRTGTVTFTTSAGSPAMKQTVSVTQAGQALPTLTVSPTSWTAPADGGSQVIQVTSNTSWSVSTSIDAMQVTPKSGTGNASVTVTLPGNPLGVDLPLSVTFTTTGDTPQLSQQVQISQPAQNSLLLWPSLFNSSFPAPGGSASASVISNTSWSVASDLPEWVTANESSGSGDGLLSLTAKPNLSGVERSVTVIVETTSDGLHVTRSITFKQPSGSMLMVLPAFFSRGFPAGGGSYSFIVSANASWQVSGMPDWVTPHVINGGAPGPADASTVTLTALPNTTGQARSAQITVQTTSGTPTVRATLTINQPAK